MTTEELQAIGHMMDEKLAASRKELMQDVATLMDAQFKHQFNLLAEGQQDLKDRLPAMDTMEKMQDELDLHHMLLKQHTQEIKNLKKAN